MWLLLFVCLYRMTSQSAIYVTPLASVFSSQSSCSDVEDVCTVCRASVLLRSFASSPQDAPNVYFLPGMYNDSCCLPSVLEDLGYQVVFGSSMHIQPAFGNGSDIYFELSELESWYLWNDTHTFNVTITSVPRIPFVLLPPVYLPPGRPISLDLRNLTLRGSSQREEWLFQWWGHSLHTQWTLSNLTFQFCDFTWVYVRVDLETGDRVAPSKISILDSSFVNSSFEIRSSLGVEMEIEVLRSSFYSQFYGVYYGDGHSQGPFSYHSLPCIFASSEDSLAFRVDESEFSSLDCAGVMVECSRNCLASFTKSNVSAFVAEVNSTGLRSCLFPHAIGLLLGSGASVSNIDMRECRIVGGDVGAFGAGLTVERGLDLEITITNSVFERLLAVVGGAIVIDSTQIVLTVRNVRFQACESDWDGGAIAIGVRDSLSATFENVSAIQNVAAMDGGFMSIRGGISSSSVVLSFVDGWYEGNVARTGQGGVLSIVRGGDSVSVISRGTKFISNKARLGGGISIQGVGDVVFRALESSLFTNNTALISGGAIAFAEGNSHDIVLDGCRFISNRAAEDGGALEFDAKGVWFRLHATRSLFQRNTAGRYGGAVFLGFESDCSAFDRGYDSIAFVGDLEDPTSMSFESNVAASGLGSSVYLEAVGQAERIPTCDFRNVVFSNERGSPLRLESPTIRAVNLTFVDTQEAKHAGGWLKAACLKLDTIALSFGSSSIAALELGTLAGSFSCVDDVRLILQNVRSFEMGGRFLRLFGVETKLRLLNLTADHHNRRLDSSPEIGLVDFDFATTQMSDGIEGVGSEISNWVLTSNHPRILTISHLAIEDELGMIVIRDSEFSSPLGTSLVVTERFLSLVSVVLDGVGIRVDEGASLWLEGATVMNSMGISLNSFREFKGHSLVVRNNSKLAVTNHDDEMGGDYEMGGGGFFVRFDETSTGFEIDSNSLFDSNSARTGGALFFTGNLSNDAIIHLGDPSHCDSTSLFRDNTAIERGSVAAFLFSSNNLREGRISVATRPPDVDSSILIVDANGDGLVEEELKNSWFVCGSESWNVACGPIAFLKSSMSTVSCVYDNENITRFDCFLDGIFFQDCFDSPTTHDFGRDLFVSASFPWISVASIAHWIDVSDPVVSHCNVDEWCIRFEAVLDRPEPTLDILYVEIALIVFDQMKQSITLPMKFETCGIPSSDGNHCNTKIVSLSIGLSLGLGVPALCILLVIALLFGWCGCRIVYRKGGEHVLNLEMEGVEIPLRVFLGEEIGRGAFSTVYRAEMKTGPNTNEVVAVKTFSDQIDLPEVSLMVAMSHPAILKCFGGFWLGEKHYIALEYCSLGSLERVLRIRRPSFPSRLSFIKQIADAMNYLHSHAISHRDLKPENIFVREEEEGKDLVIKVGDFGLSRVGGNQLEVEQDANIVVGTPGYLCPRIFARLTAEASLEPLQNDSLWLQGDVFAFGVLLYEIWTLSRAYTRIRMIYGSNPLALLTMIHHHSLRPRWPSIDRTSRTLDVALELKALSEACWVSESELRPPFQEICERLNGLFVPVVESEEEDEDEEESRRRKIGDGFLSSDLQQPFLPHRGSGEDGAEELFLRL